MQHPSLPDLEYELSVSCRCDRGVSRLLLGLILSSMTLVFSLCIMFSREDCVVLLESSESVESAEISTRLLFVSLECEDLTFESSSSSSLSRVRSIIPNKSFGFLASD